MANSASLLAEKQLFFARLANHANAQASMDKLIKDDLRLATAKGWLAGGNRVVPTDLDSTPYTLSDFNTLIAAFTQMSNVASGQAVTALDVLGAIDRFRSDI